jgi:hypothetical protein
VKLVAGFGKFWFDFIVGDSIVLAVGGGAALAIGALLVRFDALFLAEVALPATVVGCLGWSLRSRF